MKVSPDTVEVEFEDAPTLKEIFVHIKQVNNLY